MVILFAVVIAPGPQTIVGRLIRSRQRAQPSASRLCRSAPADSIP